MSESGAAVFLRLGPSPRLNLVLAALHAGAVVCGLASELPPDIQGTLIVLVTVSGWRTVVLHGTRRAARSIVLLAWDRHGQWRLVRRDGRVLDATLAPGGFSHPQLIVLPFRSRGGRALSLSITPDMADGDGLRRLRARLRCAPCAEPAGSSRGAVC